MVSCSVFVQAGRYEVSPTPPIHSRKRYLHRPHCCTGLDHHPHLRPLILHLPFPLPHPHTHTPYLPPPSSIPHLPSHPPHPPHPPPHKPHYRIAFKKLLSLIPLLLPLLIAPLTCSLASPAAIAPATVPSPPGKSIDCCSSGIFLYDGFREAAAARAAARLLARRRCFLDFAVGVKKEGGEG